MKKIICVLMTMCVLLGGVSSVNALEETPTFLQTRAAGTYYESESNNSLADADLTYDDYDNYGSISSSNDVDWWKVVFAENGQANFWMGNIPDNCNYQLYLYNSNSTLLSSSTTDQSQELIQYNVVAGIVYYVKIISTSGYSSSNYYFRTKNYPTTPTSTTWFSQKNSSLGTTWNSANLTSLYFPNMTNCKDYCNGVFKCANTPCYTTASYSPTSTQLNMGHINKFGCNMSSMAMIFRNLGATTSSSKYDFRSGTNMNQPADPFTLTMANIGWPTITQNTVNGVARYEITSYATTYNPTYTRWATACAAFGLTPYKIEFTNLDEDVKADIMAYYLARNPEGILVRVSNSHSIVFTDTTHTVPTSADPSWPQPYRVTASNEVEILKQEIEQEQNSVARAAVSVTDFDSKFTCYDPGTSNALKGNGVTYNNSWTASYYGGIDQVVYIYYFD